MRRARAHTGLKVVPLERAVVAFAVSLHEIKTGASTWRRRSSDSGFAVALPRPVEDLGLAGRTGSGRGRTRPGLITAEPVDARSPVDRAIVGLLVESHRVVAQYGASRRAPLRSLTCAGSAGVQQRPPALMLPRRSTAGAASCGARVNSAAHRHAAAHVSVVGLCPVSHTQLPQRLVSNRAISYTRSGFRAHRR